jgi:hypothetical protein
VEAHTEEPAQEQLADEAATAAPSRSRHTRRRLYGMRALVVLGTVIVVFGAIAIWINRVALNENTWADTSTKVLQNDTVRQTLATYVVDQVYSNVDVAAQLRAVLPERAKPLAAPAAAGLHDPAVRFTDEALQRPRVVAAWRLANRQADHLLLQVIEDKVKGPLSTSNGAVTIDLRPLVQQTIARLGLTQQASGRIPPNTGRIVLLRSDQLSLAQKIVRALRAISSALVALVVLIFAVAVWIAPDRRRAVRACAIGLIVAGLVLIFVRRVLGDQLIDRVVADQTVRPAAHEIWWIATDSLRLAITSILFVGLVGLLGAWIAGAGKHATATRSALAPYLREPLVAYGALAAVILLLLVWAPTPAAGNWVTVTLLGASAVIGLEVLRRQAAREFPDAERGQLSLSRQAKPEDAPAASPDDERLARLSRLGELHASGVLDDGEFAREKERVLAGTPS